MSVRYLALLRGMLSPAWQKPSDRKIERTIRALLAAPETPQAHEAAPKNRHRLMALVAADTKLRAAACLVKEATIDLARSGLLPREPVQEIAAEIDGYLVRITAAIELIP